MFFLSPSNSLQFSNFPKLKLILLVDHVIIIWYICLIFILRIRFLILLFRILMFVLFQQQLSGITVISFLSLLLPQQFFLFVVVISVFLWNEHWLHHYLWPLVLLHILGLVIFFFWLGIMRFNNSLFESLSLRLLALYYYRIFVCWLFNFYKDLVLIFIGCLLNKTISFHHLESLSPWHRTNFLNLVWGYAWYRNRRLFFISRSWSFSLFLHFLWLFVISHHSLFNLSFWCHQTIIIFIIQSHQICMKMLQIISI